jgi:hypothetical protein
LLQQKIQKLSSLIEVEISVNRSKKNGWRGRQTMGIVFGNWLASDSYRIRQPNHILKSSKKVLTTIKKGWRDAKPWASFLLIGWRERQPTHIFKSSIALYVSLHFSDEVSHHFHINRYFVKN